MHEPATAYHKPFALTGVGSGTILLVEDEESLCRMAREILLRVGYHVVCAHTGEAAIEISQRLPDRIDLLLTDMVMRGGMNGRELAEFLKKQRPEMRVLYMSGYSGELAAWHGVPEDTAFLEKPFTTESLLGKVAESLETKKQPQGIVRTIAAKASGSV